MQVVTDALQRKQLMQMLPHDGSMFSITFKHARIKSRESSHARRKYAMWKKKCVFRSLLYTGQLSLFRPVVEYYIMDILYIILMVMCIPDPVYNSLDVRYTVFFYNYKFRERDDVGACCNICLGVGFNTYSGADSMHFCGDLHIVIQPPNLACDISIVIKSIL